MVVLNAEPVNCQESIFIYALCGFINNQYDYDKWSRYTAKSSRNGEFLRLSINVETCASQTLAKLAGLVNGAAKFHLGFTTAY